MQEPEETCVSTLGWEDPLEEGMATHSSILARITPWTEEPGGLQSMESQSQTWLSDWAYKCTLADSHWQCRWFSSAEPLLLQSSAPHPYSVIPLPHSLFHQTFPSPYGNFSTCFLCGLNAEVGRCWCTSFQDNDCHPLEGSVNLLEVLFKHSFLGSTPWKVYNSVGLGWGLRVWISENSHFPDVQSYIVCSITAHPCTPPNSYPPRTSESDLT